MLGIFGRNKPLSTVEILSLEKNISEAKIRYILELEGKICSLDVLCFWKLKKKVVYRSK